MTELKTGYAPKTRGDQLHAVLWFLIAMVIVGASAYGWSIGDLPGGLLMSFLPVAFLTDILVVSSFVMKSSLSQSSKWVWLTVSLTALFAAILFAQSSEPEAIKGADTILAYTMLIMAFPSALLVPFAMVVLAPLLSGTGNSLFALTGMWCLFAMAGYLQWFVLLPLLWKKMKPKNR